MNRDHSEQAAFPSSTWYKKKLIDTRWPLAQTFGNLVGQSLVEAPFLLVNLPFAPPESPVSPNMIIGFV